MVMCQLINNLWNTKRKRKTNGIISISYTHTKEIVTMAVNKIVKERNADVLYN